MTALHYTRLKMMTGRNILPVAGMAAGMVVYLAAGAENQVSSPLALLVMAAAGWLMSLKWELAGAVMLFFAGASLLVHPFLFASLFWYTLVAVPFCLAGVNGFLKWWRSGEN